MKEIVIDSKHYVIVIFSKVLSSKFNADRTSLTEKKIVRIKKCLSIKLLEKEAFVCNNYVLYG